MRRADSRNFLTKTNNFKASMVSSSLFILLLLLRCKREGGLLLTTSLAGSLSCLFMFIRGIHSSGLACGSKLGG